MPILEVKSNDNPFLLARLVVISITPLAPLEPYIEVAAASFKMSTDSMSSGFNVANGLLLNPPLFPLIK